MSVASKRARRIKRGGIAGHLRRVSALLQPDALPPNATPEQRFADAVTRGWPLYAHPETAAKARADGLPVRDCWYIQIGQIIAARPERPYTGAIVYGGMP